MSEKLPTIKEIARALDVSISTVSRALNDHPGIGIRTKTRVREMARKLNYEPNKMALFFQQRKTYTIGVILPELSEDFFSAAISGIEDAAEKNDYTVLVGQSHDDPAREKKIIESMRNHRVDGIIISLTKNTVDYGHLRLLAQSRIPIVYFDRIPDMENIHFVSCNMISGTIQAVDFLLKKGHRTIGMVNGPPSLFASSDRKKGYEQALRRNRLKFDPAMIAESDLSAEGNYQAMAKLFSSKRKPTAIVLFNDYVVMDAIRFARDRQLQINKDICFVSYANLPVSNYMAYPPLASVEQFPYAQGRKATDILMELLAQRELNEPAGPSYYKVILDSELVVHDD